MYCSSAFERWSRTTCVAHSKNTGRFSHSRCLLKSLKPTTGARVDAVSAMASSSSPGLLRRRPKTSSRMLYATLATDERAEKIHDSAVVQDMEAGIKKLKAGVGKKMTKLRGSSKAPAPDGPPAAYATAAATEAEAAEAPAAETPAAEP